jgi:hypothetical protein
MRLLLIVLVSICAFSAAAQKKKIISAFATLQFTKTTKDITLGNNPWGIGVGAEAFMNVSKVFKPVMEITGDLYLEDDKVGRMSNDVMIPDVFAISKILGGISLQGGKYVNVAMVAGPAFLNKEVRWAVKPSVHLFLGDRERVFLKFALIRVYNRVKNFPDEFDSYSVGIGLKFY